MEETGDTATADTGAPTTCPRVSGTGCGGASEPQGAECTEDGEPEAQVIAAPGDVRGGACSCHAGPAPLSGAWILLVVLWCARRRLAGPALVLLVGLVAAAPARAQVNAQQLRVVDGGDFPALRDAGLGPRWSGSVTLSMNHARDLVVLEGVPDARVLVEQVTTRAVSASLNLGAVSRLGFSAPWHWPAIVDDTRYGVVPGDVALWIAVPLTAEDARLQGSWTVQLDLGAGPAELYLGDPGVVRGIIALETPAGPLRALTNLSLNFHRDVPLPGVVYGNHWGYGLGLRAEPAGPVFAVVELTGEAPVRFWGGLTAQYPLEALLSVGTVPTRLLSLSGGIGSGLTRGLGSPSLRLVGTLDVRPRTPKDTDGDGISDLRDLCRQQPEDRDGFHDSDGCPDPDNDQDGLLDGRDDCPSSAENLNGYEDWDGCPERVTFLTLRVTGGEALEQASVQLGDAEAFVVLPGEPIEKVLELDTVEVSVSADEHVSFTEELDLTGSDRAEHVVRLQPLRYGAVALSVVDDRSRPIEGATVAVDGGPPAALEGELRLPVGPTTLRVTAEGWGTERVVVEVPDDGRLPLTVVLGRERVVVDGTRLQPADSVAFELDEATLLPEGRAAIADLAGWLQDHDDVRLLRIEGHADASGTSLHNLELSRARAESVRALLVELGIDAQRLEAIGTGEARPVLDGDDGSRRVEFLVLVRDEPDDLTPE